MTAEWGDDERRGVDCHAALLLSPIDDLCEAVAWYGGD